MDSSKTNDSHDKRNHSIEESEAKVKQKKTVKIKKHFTQQIWSCLKNEEKVIDRGTSWIKSLPFQIWSFFIQAFTVPSYRPEWGKYATWDHHIPPQKIGRFHRPKTSMTPKKKSSQKLNSDSLPVPTPHNHSECLTVRINVSGKIFEPQIRTLKQFPSTLLGSPKRMIQFYDPVRDEFFFDRNRTCFEAIIYYYQSGGIVRHPSSTSLEMFIEEVKFFDLGDAVIEALDSTEGFGEEEKPLPKNLLQRKLWLLFEYPESSYQSRIVAYWSVFVVCVSIFEFCCETIPSFKWGTKGDDANRSEGTHPIDFVAGNIVFNIRDPFFFTETICVIFFIFELFMRAATCPRFFTFAKEINNLIDLLAIIPYFVGIVYEAGHPGLTDEEADTFDKSGVSNGRLLQQNHPRGHNHHHTMFKREVSLTILRVIRLVRVFRILKLSRHNRGLKILGKTLRASIRELGLLVFFLLIGVVVFSSAIFLAESHIEDTDFTSIPSGFWFGITTMTTLGYGDLVPEGITGKIVGSLCAIAGVLTISLPVPVIVSNFNTFYTRDDAVNKDGRKSSNNHVEQCPYYPAWYTTEGEFIAERGCTKQNYGRTGRSGAGNAWPWLRGEQRRDVSESEFETLKEDGFRADGHLRKKRTTGHVHFLFRRKQLCPEMANRSSYQMWTTRYDNRTQRCYMTSHDSSVNGRLYLQ